MSSLVFTSINVHIPRLLERRADSRRCALLCRVSYRLHQIIATLGISLVDASEGRCVFEGSLAEWQYNPLGTVHGGWPSALFDSALGCAVQTVLPGGCGFTTLDLHVRF
jgi:acyl-coenzyme A thioesterase PaaI-like protein